MALRYVVKKRMIGFGKEKTEKYVAQNFITNTVNFKELCDEISKVGMVPSGAVKFVLDALIDTLNINLNKGISVQLGDFGQFRPGISSESQETEAAVDSDTIRRVKIVFTPGYKFKDMLKKFFILRSVQSPLFRLRIVDKSNHPDCLQLLVPVQFRSRDLLVRGRKCIHRLCKCTFS